MSTLLYGLMRGPVPADEQTVRSTTEYVDVEREPAATPDVPEFNEVETDGNPDLGMVNRTLASHWVERDKYAPSWAGQATSITDGEASRNRRQASDGTAAGRELDGQFGHGTMSYAVGIEPVLREGAAFGTDYFTAHERGIQQDVRPYLNPALGDDRQSVSAVAGAAKTSARDAAAAGWYSTWYENMVGVH